MSYAINPATKTINHIASDGLEYCADWSREPRYVRDRLPWRWMAAVWSDGSEEAALCDDEHGRATSEPKAIEAASAWLKAQEGAAEVKRG